MSLHRADRHPALHAYLDRIGVARPADRPDGAVVLVYRDALRVMFHPLGAGELVLEARIADMSRQSAAQVGALCLRALELAGQRPWQHVQSIALNPEPAALLLHQWVSADCPVQDLERQIDDFLSALVGWRSAMELEAA